MHKLTLNDLVDAVELDQETASRHTGGFAPRGQNRTAATGRHTEREAAQNWSSPAGFPQQPPKNDGPSPKDAVAESTVYIVLDIVSNGINVA